MGRRRATTSKDPNTRVSVPAAVPGYGRGMTPADVLTDAFGRIREGAHRVLSDLDEDALAWRPGPDANPIGWLVWHLLRVQDDHLAEVAGTEQVWTAQGYAGRAGLPYADDATGFGHSSTRSAGCGWAPSCWAPTRTLS